MRTPSSTALMLGTAPGGSNPWISSMSDTQVKLPVLTAALQDRHRGIGNVLFMDAHVDPHTPQDYVANIPTKTPVPSLELGKTWTSITQ